MIEYKPDEQPLNGVFPQPALLPGIAHWQLVPVVDALNGDVAWSPDGRFIAACGSATYVFDAATLKLMAMLKCKGSHVDWSHDSKMLVVSSRSKLNFCGFDGEQSTSIKTPFSVTRVAWSPDGCWVAACWRTGGARFQDKTVRLWRPDGTPGPIFQGHTEVLRDAAWSPDSKWLASGGGDKTLRLWNADGKSGPVMRGHTDAINSVSWGPDSQQVVTSSDDGTLRVWDRVSGESRIVFPAGRKAKTRVGLVRWSPDGKWIAFRSNDGVQLIQPDGKLGPLIAAQGEHAWSPSGDRIAVGLKLYKPAGTLQREVPQVAQTWLSLVNLSPNGRHLACVREGRQICLITGQGEFRRSLTPLEDDVTHLKWSPDSRWLLAACKDDGISLWHNDGELRTVIEADTDEIADVSWSPDSKSIAAATGQVIRVRRTDGRPAPEIVGHSGTVRRLTWSPDGRWIASASDDKTARLWRADGTPGTILTGHESGVVDVAWSPDGKRLATAGGDDATVRLWTADGTPGPVLEDPAPVRILPQEAFGGSSHRVNCVAWSPDGRCVASGGDDWKLRIWQADGTPVAVVGGFNKIPWVTWSPDSQWIFPGQFGVWKADGSLGYRFHHLGSSNPTLGWSPDSSQFVYAIGNRLICHDAQDGGYRWISLPLDDSSWATFGGLGELLAGDPAEVNKYFAFLVDTDTSHVHVQSQEEFRERIRNKASRSSGESNREMPS